MVVRVFGTVDGTEVVLEHYHGDVWRVPVSLDQDGEYVVEIIAEDDAGNRAYMAKMLFVVNTALLCVHVIPIPYYAALIEPSLQIKIMPEQYEVSIEESEYTLRPMPPIYYTEIIEPVCRLAGRR